MGDGAVSSGVAGAGAAAADAAAGPGGSRLRVRTVEILPGEVVLIDQLALPQEERYVHCRTWRDVADRIADMTVRGAPAIGVTAAGGLALAAAEAAAASADPAAFEAALEQAASGLLATRPTAVNLRWALDEMRRAWETELAAPQAAPAAVAGALLARAQAIHDDDVDRCLRIGEHGAPLFKTGDRILTHCNAGALATAGYGTALGVIRSAAAHHGRISVWVDETRPWLQGARLTAWELQVEGIPYWLISDNMAGYFMRRGEVDGVVVGADRIAANGDTANKIGTYSVSVLAKAARRAVLRRGASLHRRHDHRRRRRHPHRGARPGRGHVVPRAAGRAGWRPGASPGVRRHPGRQHRRHHHGGRCAAAALR